MSFNSERVPFERFPDDGRRRTARDFEPGAGQGRVQHGVRGAGRARPQVRRPEDRTLGGHGRLPKGRMPE